MDRSVNPADEARHQPGGERLWSESVYLDWFTADGALGGYVRLGILPNLGRCWYWACLVGRDRPLVTVIDHDVALPPHSQSLEVRAEGLWADHVVEDPLVHMTANLEAFGLELGDPLDVYGEPRGDRVPFGFELDWETDRATFVWPDIQARYEIPCRVHGVVLVGDEEIEVDGWGQRDHSWGERDWWDRSWCWSAGRLADGTRWHTTGAVIEDSDWGVAYELDGDGRSLVEHDRVVHDLRFESWGLPATQRMEAGQLDLRVVPEALAPVRVDHPDDQRVARFSRALCRVEDANRGPGFGWFEWNQPGDQRLG